MSILNDKENIREKKSEDDKFSFEARPIIVLQSFSQASLLYSVGISGTISIVQGPHD